MAKKTRNKIKQLCAIQLLVISNWFWLCKSQCIWTNFAETFAKKNSFCCFRVIAILYRMKKVELVTSKQNLWFHEKSTIEVNPWHFQYLWHCLKSHVNMNKSIAVATLTARRSSTKQIKMLQNETMSQFETTTISRGGNDFFVQDDRII